MKDGHPQEPGRRLNRLRGRGKATAGAVGSDGIVLAPPLLDQHGRLRQRVEDLPVQQLVPELAVEALVVAVLPRAASSARKRSLRRSPRLLHPSSGSRPLGRTGHPFSPVPRVLRGRGEGTQRYARELLEGWCNHGYHPDRDVCLKLLFRLSHRIHRLDQPVGLADGHDCILAPMVKLDRRKIADEVHG